MIECSGWCPPVGMDGLRGGFDWMIDVMDGWTDEWGHGCGLSVVLVFAGVMRLFLNYNMVSPGGCSVDNIITVICRLVVCIRSR